MRLFIYKGHLLIVIILCALFLFMSCGLIRSKRNTIKPEVYGSMSTYQLLGEVSDGIIVVKDTIDLKGSECRIPNDVKLIFKGGIIKNGSLVGNNTEIERENNAIFDKITIKGSWCVPIISTSLFVDLNYRNSLKDLIALSHPDITNHIIIENGIYHVGVNGEKDVCLKIKSNTKLDIKGTIVLEPNNYESYHIILAQGENIVISGEGIIIGDKDNHIGRIGEWGMGINIKRAKNIIVTGLSIKDCWGDCIYVGGGSQNVVIENCVIDNGRRQGISITKGNDIIIRNCKVLNVGGTNPGYAIDIEPNKDCTVNNITIENVVIEGCEGGIVTTKGKYVNEAKRIGIVKVKKCTVSALKKNPLRLNDCERVSIEDCIVFGNNVFPPIYTCNSRQVTIRKNIVYLNQNEHTEKRRAHEILTNSSQIQPIEIVNADIQSIRGNIIKD